jgi:lysophospholipase L1-like esterase
MSDIVANRRQFLAAALAGPATAASTAVAAPVSPKVEQGIAWYNVQDWGIEGKGWNDTARYFDRFPSRAQGRIPDSVWGLSRHSAGMLVRFETDAPAIHARYQLLSSNLALPHMPATGVSGVDLYARDERGRDRWLAINRPTAQQFSGVLANNIDRRPNSGSRLFTLYLPLYNGVEWLHIGVPEGSRFDGVAPRPEKPILFYGTSIMHGACASRTGMSITGLVGRRLRRPVINLGFSGNGRMEASVGALLAELDPSVYAIDCLPNMTPALVAERTEPLVRQLRAARPGTPILLVEDRTFTSAPFLRGSRDGHTERRARFREAFEKLEAAGVSGLTYLRGEALLGDDGEGATDGSHPNDLGMTRYADAYVRALRPLLR